MAEIKIAVPYNHPIMVADRKRKKNTVLRRTCLLV